MLEQARPETHRQRRHVRLIVDPKAVGRRGERHAFADSAGDDIFCKAGNHSSPLSTTGPTWRGIPSDEKILGVGGGGAEING